MELLTEWLFQQGPIVVILGIVLFTLAKWAISLYNDIKEKDKCIAEINEKAFALAEKVIVIATMYEAKVSKTSTDHGFIREILIEIRTLLKDLKESHG